MVAIDASEILGAPQTAGVVVNPAGTLSRGTVAAAGAVVLEGASGNALIGQCGYVAVTNDEVALIRLDNGYPPRRFADLVDRIWRSQVISAELGRIRVGYGGLQLGLGQSLTIRFADGRAWLLEVPLPPVVSRGGSFGNGARARAVVATLTTPR